MLDVFGTDVVPGGQAVPVRQRAAVMFTSGTTGQPKGVELTQANYAFTGMTMAEACGLRPEHRQLVVLPLFHANAQFYSVASAIWAGASVALMHTFSASGFLRQAAAHGATHASLFAAPMRMILARSEPPAAPIGLQHCWYAMNITPDQHDDARRVVRVPAAPAVRDDRDGARPCSPSRPPIRFPTRWASRRPAASSTSTARSCSSAASPASRSSPATSTIR